MRKLATTVLIGSALVLQACGGGISINEPDRLLAFTVVENTAFSAVRAPRQVAVNDDAAWVALWAEHKALQAPQPPRPEVAFPRETLAAIFLGEVASCTRPRVDAVRETPGFRITVEWTRVPPQPNEACVAAVVHPVQMVRFDNRRRMPVEFAQAP